MKKLLLKGGRLIDAASSTDKVGDILIEGTKIKEVSENLPEDEDIEVYHLDGKVVTPGFIDVHTHLREPGREDEEDIESLSYAASCGGFTTILCMPNTQPVVDNRQVVEYIYSRAKRHSLVNIKVIGSITKNLEGKELADISEMVAAGIVGISDDGGCVVDTNLMRQVLEYVRLFDIVVISHPEDKTLTKYGVMHEGYISSLLGVVGIPSYAEEIIVYRDITLVKNIENAPWLHFAHISTKQALALIKEAKSQGLPISCETTPHHFTLSHDYLLSFDTNYKVNPPLRTQEDIEFIIEQLKEDVVEIIATDHAPHSTLEKEMGFVDAPFGIIGLETALPLCITKLHIERKIELIDIIKKLTYNPARIFKLKNKGQLKPGYDADITVVDLNLKKRIDKFHSKCSNSPFIGWYLQGFPVMTIVEGKIVYKDL